MFSKSYPIHKVKNKNVNKKSGLKSTFNSKPVIRNPFVYFKERQKHLKPYLDLNRLRFRRVKTSFVIDA